jgi:hypothetical protein
LFGAIESHDRCQPGNPRLKLAGTVHYRIVQLRVSRLEPHSVAPPGEDRRTCPAAAILTASIDESRDMRLFGRRG